MFFGDDVVIEGSFGGLGVWMMDVARIGGVLRRVGGLALALGVLTSASPAAASPFGDGWSLDEEASRLTFQSIKKGSVVETSKFASYSGEIGPDGKATITIQLDSVDTGVDLRNVRMRFLFFETFKFPQATITARIDAGEISALATRRRMVMPVEYVLDLHGVQQSLTAQTVVTLIADDMVSVASEAPVSVAATEFDLEEGVKKLEDAAKVTIVPSGSVSFDFIFRPVTAATPDPVLAEAPKSAAVETSGDFSGEECAGRFEILSRTGAIYFKSGSADLDTTSGPLLTSVAEIIERCPSLNLIVEGHTDSIGAAALNQTLSEQRAKSVARYLTGMGVDAGRLSTVGYGETKPVAPNDTERNMGRNRRIQFTVASR